MREWICCGWPLPHEAPIWWSITLVALAILFGLVWAIGAKQ
jgi:hypothetical protein